MSNFLTGLKMLKFKKYGSELISNFDLEQGWKFKGKNQQQKNFKCCSSEEKEGMKGNANFEWIAFFIPSSGKKFKSQAGETVDVGKLVSLSSEGIKYEYGD